MPGKRANKLQTRSPGSRAAQISVRSRPTELFCSTRLIAFRVTWRHFYLLTILIQLAAPDLAESITFQRNLMHVPEFWAWRLFNNDERARHF